MGGRFFFSVPSKWCADDSTSIDFDTANKVVKGRHVRVICVTRVCARACHTNVAYPPFRSAPLSGARKKKGGQMGFCEIVRYPAVFCENLRFPAVSCENLRLRYAVLPRKSENLQKSAKICKKKTESLAPFVPSSLSLLILLQICRVFLAWNDK